MLNYENQIFGYDGSKEQVLTLGSLILLIFFIHPFLTSLKHSLNFGDMSTSELNTLIQQFETIGLEEMDAVQLMNRVDTKFTFNQNKLGMILPLLMADYKVLNVENSLITNYESMYFDDADLSAFSDHQRKKLNRFKVRFRKYMNSGISFLEVKHKINGRTEKTRIPVDVIPEKMTEEQLEFVRISGVEGNLIPSLMNTFSRITFVHKTIPERLTLDVDISYQWEGSEKEISNIVIAELKQHKAQRNSIFFQLMKTHQIRPLRISKYCIGIIKMYGKSNVKYNRFKKKLITLKKIQTHAA